MIFITGDTHQIDIQHRFNTNNFPAGKLLTKDDYVIICGDVGILWGVEMTPTEKYLIKWLDEKPWTTLFVLGNHENYDRWDAMEKIDWHGGKVNKLTDSVIHLCSGEVFDIDGYKIFTMDGAASHDIKDGILEWTDPRVKKWSKDPFKLFRINKVSWWEHEMPTEEDYSNASNNLKKHNFCVDCIITHSPSTAELKIMSGEFVGYKPDRLTEFLQEIKNKTNYRYSFFGHMHQDISFNGEIDTCVYEKIIQLPYNHESSSWF